MNLPRSGATKEPSSIWRGPPRRVLILDDDELIVRAVSRVLKRVGLEVEGTTDPEEATASALHRPPDVVVSDLHMPRACGAAFLTSMVAIAPAAMRVLVSADVDFRPEIGSVAEAQVHALMSKSELPRLGAVLVEQLRGRLEQPEVGAARDALARSVAHALGRPGFEDDAHRDRLARWSSEVATTMGLPPEAVEQARLGAILHDVGQVALRERVFARAGLLTGPERDELADHPSAGARIVAEMPALRDALLVIRAHHERQDGGGYPAHLDRTSIPPAAAAFQVADAYEAMTRGRPHTPRRSHREAIRELAANAGRQHHPDAVQAIRALPEESLAS